jgi:ribosomal protein S27AE
MRFLHISGPGVANDEEFCPHCQVLLEDREDYKVCRLCHYDTRQSAGQRRIRVRRR